MDRIAKFLILLVAALVLVPGCFAEEMTEEPTTVADLPKEVEVIEVSEVVDETPSEEIIMQEVITPDFTANMTVTMLEMGINQTVAIALTAEEVEGIWNISMSEGLIQIGNSTVTNGTEEWIIEAIGEGDQFFSAVHEAIDASAIEAGETYKLDIVIA